MFDRSIYPLDTADYGPADDRVADETVTSCRVCGALAIDHTQGRYSIFGTCPR